MSATETITAASPSASAEEKKQETHGSLNLEAQEPYRYTHLLPTFTHSSYPPLAPFEHVDPGHRALSHPDPTAFLASATSVADITPTLGTEVRGINLARLNSDERDELALFVARRGLAVFRGQSDFIDQDPEGYKEWGSYFGRLHIHPTSGHPAGLPEIHLVYRDANSTFNFERSESTTSTVWHSDVSYELQPPGLTTFFLLAQPKTGGDTLFTNQSTTLSKLSPSFVAFLRTLSAVHSGVEQAEYSRRGNRGGIVRREPVENVHPIVRKHPVTGAEALYVNRQFTRRIVGLKKEESDTILEFLYSHIERAGDCQARVRWEPGTVVLWDNRITAHSAIIDFQIGESKERRHGARITPQAERPIPA